MDKYTLGELLGKGKFGYVFSATTLTLAGKEENKKEEHKKEVAIKTINIKRIGLAEKVIYQNINAERGVLRRTNHPNIIKLIDYIVNVDMVWIVLEYMKDGDLYEMIKTKKTNEHICSLYMRQIISAIAYLHNLLIAHRDIKPENILISGDKIKVCDFGWSHTFKSKDETITELCGTLDYLPPEIVKNVPYGLDIDIWSLGVLTYETVVHTTPFNDPTYKGTYTNIQTCSYDCPDTVSQSCQDFIEKLLVLDPPERMRLDQALNHEFLLIKKK